MDSNYDSSDSEIAEPVTMDTRIPSSNVGFQMMLRMGWKAGTGLGSDEQGRQEPVRIDGKQDALGIGKAEEEAAYHIESTKKRKALESEKLEAETDEQRVRREDQVARQEATKREVESMNASFYCSLCDKRYTRISEYETHLSSYDHNHKKRFKEMQQTIRASASQTDREKRREKERKREERELRKLQEAAAKKASAQPSTPANMGR